ncbi:hypothetical protein [Rubrivivax gelatinosus]|nr:hypothetical protein [Rubrivivax gelatinosus]
MQSALSVIVVETLMLLAGVVAFAGWRLIMFKRISRNAQNLRDGGPQAR